MRDFIKWHSTAFTWKWPFLPFIHGWTFTALKDWKAVNTFFTCPYKDAQLIDWNLLGNFPYHGVYLEGLTLLLKILHNFKVQMMHIVITLLLALKKHSFDMKSFTLCFLLFFGQKCLGYFKKKLPFSYICLLGKKKKTG